MAFEADTDEDYTDVYGNIIPEGSMDSKTIDLHQKMKAGLLRMKTNDPTLTSVYYSDQIDEVFSVEAKNSEARFLDDGDMGSNGLYKVFIQALLANTNVKTLNLTSTDVFELNQNDMIDIVSYKKNITHLSLKLYVDGNVVLINKLFKCLRDNQSLRTLVIDIAFHKHKPTPSIPEVKTMSVCLRNNSYLIDLIIKGNVTYHLSELFHPLTNMLEVNRRLENIVIGESEDALFSDKLAQNKVERNKERIWFLQLMVDLITLSILQVDLVKVILWHVAQLCTVSMGKHPQELTVLIDFMCENKKKLQDKTQGSFYKLTERLSEPLTSPCRFQLGFFRTQSAVASNSNSNENAPSALQQGIKRSRRASV